MSEIIDCPNCGKKLTILKDHYGKAIRCQHCGQEMEIVNEETDQPIKLSRGVLKQTATPAVISSATPRDATPTSQSEPHYLKLIHEMVKEQLDIQREFLGYMRIYITLSVVGFLLWAFVLRGGACN